MFRHLASLTILAAALGLGGCASEIETSYGERSGGAANSVNGTSVFSRMFEQAGHRVSSWRALSPRLARADCIVWFPDDFEPPTPEVRAWLQDWLWTEPGRTLVYVGRDYDAEALYWQTIQPQAPPGQAAEVARRLAAAQFTFRMLRNSTAEEDAEWFTLLGTDDPRSVRTLSGSREWLAGVDPAKLEIELAGRYEPSPGAEVLLASEGDMLVSREEFGDSQLLVVTNGSFLLNLSLVNHEHRKLAARLIDEVGAPSQNVVFLESGPGGPPLREADPQAETPSGLEILVTRPYIWVFLHVLLVAALVCLARWPIFGVPRQLQPDDASDFGRHIDALAKLLENSQDRIYAQTRLLHYRQLIAERNK